MPTMGYLNKGSRVIIAFQADSTNAGVTTLIVAYSPLVVPSTGKVIAPGASKVIQIDELLEADLLRIDVNVPDQDGSGVLTVIQDDVLQHEKALYEDTTWIYLIDNTFNPGPEL